jgi:hypothetical protein
MGTLVSYCPHFDNTESRKYTNVLNIASIFVPNNFLRASEGTIQQEDIGIFPVSCIRLAGIA